MEILKQLHSYDRGIEKTRLLVHKSVYWVNLNAIIENSVKHCSTCLEHQNMQLQEKKAPDEVQVGPT